MQQVQIVKDLNLADLDSCVDIKCGSFHLDFEVFLVRWLLKILDIAVCNLKAINEANIGLSECFLYLEGLKVLHL